MAKINIDRLAVEIMEDLDIYLANTVETVGQAVEETAKETVQELKRLSPKGSTGEYADSWKQKKDPNIRGKYRMSRVVYSDKPSYRLTHLLENGHAKVNGGRVDGKPHIRRAEQLAESTLLRKLKEQLGEE